MAKYKFNELLKFVEMQVRIILNIVSENETIVAHTPNTSKLDKGKWSSWSDAWKEIYKTPIAPPNNICQCCCRKIKETESNYFVVGHVTECKTKRHYLHPVCNQCNTGMKNYKFLVNKNDLRNVITTD